MTPKMHCNRPTLWFAAPPSSAQSSSQKLWLGTGGENSQLLYTKLPIHLDLCFDKLCAGMKIEPLVSFMFFKMSIYCIFWQIVWVHMLESFVKQGSVLKDTGDELVSHCCLCCCYGIWMWRLLCTVIVIGWCVCSQGECSEKSTLIQK